MSKQIVFVPVSDLRKYFGPGKCRGDVAPYQLSRLSMKQVGDVIEKQVREGQGGTFSVTLRWGRCHNILKGFGLSNIHSIIYFVHHKLSLPNVGISNWKRTLSLKYGIAFSDQYLRSNL